MDIIKKTRDDYNRIAPHFSLTRHEARELEQFTPFIVPGQRILDWGCGNGRLVYILQNKDVEYIGTDQSAGLLKQAEELFQKELQEGWVKFICTENGETTFPENYFDLIFMIASFHHLPDEANRLELLKKVHQELKQGGKLIITVWNLESDWAKKKLDEGYKKMGEYDYLVPWKTKEGEVLAQRYYHHFTEDELRQVLEKSGFKVEEMYFESKGRRVSKKEGRNLVVVASKIK
jgi:ubiquinone/menaquinone biosynthesis C-methylase UbiE